LSKSTATATRSPLQAAKSSLPCINAARSASCCWCEDNGVDYVFGLAGSKPLSKAVEEAADAVRTERAIDRKGVRPSCVALSHADVRSAVSRGLRRYAVQR